MCLSLMLSLQHTHMLIHTLKRVREKWDISSLLPHCYNKALKKRRKGPAVNSWGLQSLGRRMAAHGNQVVLSHISLLLPSTWLVSLA